MEVIKTSSNVEFDVIYADGTRKRVTEGLLYEADETGDVIFHNGTSRPEVLMAAAEYNLRTLHEIGPGLEALAIGMVLSEESRSALKHLLSFAKALLDDGAEKQAIFRLGQMDMRESAAARLRDAAVNVYGIARATLESAADLIDEMEVTK